MDTSSPALIVTIPPTELWKAANAGKALLLIIGTAAQTYTRFAADDFVAYKLFDCEGREFCSWTRNSVLVAGQEERVKLLDLLLYQVEFTKPDGTKVVVVVDVTAESPS